MTGAGLALAFTAGLVATVNPCGFAMLPAYLSWFIGVEGGDERETRPRAIARALSVGGVVSLGFLVVFGIAGLLVTLGLRQVIDVIPWAALVVGGLVALLGIAMLLGWEPTVALPKLEKGTQSRSRWSSFVFGVSYAIASLSCTLPIFLTVVAGSISQQSVLGGTVTFLVYGVGMSLVLVVAAVALALGQRSIVGWMRRSARYINRVAGAILVVAGGYIVFFWATNLSQGIVRPQGAVGFVESLSSWATRTISDRPFVSGGVLVGVVGLAVAYLLVTRSRGEVDQPEPHLDPTPTEPARR